MSGVRSSEPLGGGQGGTATRRLLLAAAALALIAGWARTTGAGDLEEKAARARALAERGDHAAAADILETCVRGGARDAETFELLGFCLMKLRRFDEAVTAFERGVPGAYHDVNLGYCLRAVGRDAEALAVYRRAAAALPPADPWAVHARREIAALEAAVEAPGASRFAVEIAGLEGDAALLVLPRAIPQGQARLLFQEIVDGRGLRSARLPFPPHRYSREGKARERCARRVSHRAKLRGSPHGSPRFART